MVDKVDWREGREYLRFCNSYSRLPKLIELWEQSDIDERNWLMLLRSEWSVCDNIGEHSRTLMMQTPLGWIVDEPHLRRAFMSSKDWNAYQALPDELILLRGCYRQNKWGLSWSLDRATACRFPFLHRYRQDGTAMLVEAHAKKADIIGVQMERGEQEVIAWRPKHVRTIRLHHDLVAH